ncbi:hypothetical protein A2U01_0074443, partial [Trifolium medium]|nr:hypothetical protein [Trifolium medium]
VSSQKKLKPTLLVEPTKCVSGEVANKSSSF